MDDPVEIRPPYSDVRLRCNGIRICRCRVRVDAGGDVDEICDVCAERETPLGLGGCRGSAAQSTRLAVAARRRLPTPASAASPTSAPRGSRRALRCRRTLRRRLLPRVTNPLHEIVRQVGCTSLRLVDDAFRLPAEEVAFHECVEAGARCRKQDPTRRACAAISSLRRGITCCGISDIRKSFCKIDDRI
jgi:hypothetical protein